MPVFFEAYTKFRACNRAARFARAMAHWLTVHTVH